MNQKNRVFRSTLVKCVPQIEQFYKLVIRLTLEPNLSCFGKIYFRLMANENLFLWMTFDRFILREADIGKEEYF